MVTQTRDVFSTFLFFILAAFFEVGGAYLIWLWLKQDLVWIFGILGGLALFGYGIIQTFQPSHFHRIYAAYGGVFIVMAMTWGWIFDGIAPDSFDFIGVLIALVGVGVIFYWPRRGEKKWQI